MDGGHVHIHISGSSFEPDSVLAFVTFSSLSIFFCFTAEGIYSFSFDSITDDDTIILCLGTKVHVRYWHSWLIAMLMHVGLQGVSPHRLVLAKVTMVKESPIRFQQSNNSFHLEARKSRSECKIGSNVFLKVTVAADILASAFSVA